MTVQQPIRKSTRLPRSEKPAALTAYEYLHCEKPPVAKFKALVTQHPALLTASDAVQCARHEGKPHRGSLLRATVTTGMNDLSVWLLAKGAPLSDVLGAILPMAAQRANPAVVQAMLDLGADPNESDSDGNYPLGLYASCNLKALLVGGADPNAILSETKDRPLHYVELVDDAQTLLDAGADPTLRNELGELPGSDHLEDLSDPLGAFFAPYCDVNGQADEDGNTPLHGAANLSAVSALLLRGADPRAVNKQGMTPLHEAESPEVALRLLQAGADPNAKDKAGDTALHLTSDAAIAAVLISAGADVDAINKHGDSPLLGALKEDHQDIALLLVTSGAALFNIGPKNRSALDVVKASLRKNPGQEELEELLRTMEVTMERAATSRNDILSVPTTAKSAPASQVRRRRPGL